MSPLDVILTALAATPLAAVVVGFLGKTVLEARVQAEVQMQVQRRLAVDQTRWTIKRDACLAALDIVDCVWSNRDWGGLDVQRSKAPSIDEARACHNRLLLTCEGGDTARQYLRCLGAFGTVTGDAVTDLRAAIRAELGFGQLAEDRAVAWLGKIDGMSAA